MLNSHGYLFAMKTLAASFKLSLRQVEQIFTKLRISQLTVIALSN
jgi:DNA-binding IscR family transcriptional regulator